jgi:hypothetical protein
MNAMQSPILDLLPPAPAVVAEPQEVEALADRAGRVIEFALAEYGQVKALDLSLNRLALRHTDRVGAIAMRALYERWAEQAEKLLDRIVSNHLQQRMRPSVEQLQNALGLTRAMLSVSLDDLEKADEDFRTGNYKSYSSVEELRRELRTRSAG